MFHVLESLKIYYGVIALGKIKLLNITKYKLNITPILNGKFRARISFLLSQTQIFKLLANILEILYDTLHIFCNRQFIHI